MIKWSVNKESQTDHAKTLIRKLMILDEDYHIVTRSIN